MAGMKCPKCQRLTVFQTPTGKKCTNCGYEITVNPGPGKGQKCLICGKFTVFGNRCRNCGATNSGGSTQ